ncbi:MAG TPA: aldo/keto reductase [Rhodocyclaceae bacterium]|nr:aldo/keto reductase [Rhodocyclaceae bacterium]HMV52535.1 aldo/keto reductase [Rhodocyclaceae bacterium]HMZ84729.1 aldo/keto reductase [Rhodocyclaceae bacterium]HNA04457.1 aldo/keto reductase [Rhodocyclaceae bacterium]HNB80068.1 aldo/keto reductase [Rhodocyclaceae bacterium]
MRYRKLGLDGPEVSEVCLGTMTFGEQNTEAEGHAQLDHAVQHGVNFIDTAELYSVPSRPETHGRSEEIVGTWLARQPRDRVIVATKIAGPRRKLEWIRGGPLALDRENVRSAVEASLRRLRTDYIDLYQIHWPERNSPMFGQYQFDPQQERAAVSIAEQLDALTELVREGKVRWVGLSNEHPWGVAEFLKQAELHGLTRVVSVQNAYNLLNRTYETALAEMCFRENVSLLAYSPLGFGTLSGKYVADPRARGRVTLFDGFAQRYAKPNVGPAVEAYAALARRHGLSPATMALAFVFGRWFTGSTIIGATSMAQLEENIAACEVRLAPEVLNGIEQLHLRYTNPAP